MEAGSWVVLVAACVAAVGLSLWFYRRRETPGRGRALLALLRGGAIALLLILLADPSLPGAITGPGTALLLDASLSMRLPSATGGSTRWNEAVERARRRADGPVIVFGDAARHVAPDSIAALQPSATRSQLLPALQAVAEAGHKRAVVLTDRALDDADEVVRWLARLGIQLDVESVGEAVNNRGLVRVAAPSWVETGKPVVISFEVAATGASGRPFVVQARQGERVLAEAVVDAPAEGRVATGTLRFDATAPDDGELVRYDIVMEGGDAMPDDDVRAVYVRVSAEPQGAVLLSFRPDWEPRFLQPVLERSLGMPVRGFLRMKDHWRALGTGLAVGERASDEEVRRVAGQAELLVLHAWGSGASAWARQIAQDARRVLVLPAGDGTAPGLPVEAAGLVTGDWYLSDEIPPSPVAPLLAGLNVRDVPPLSALRMPPRVPGAWVPITVSRGRRGPSYPVALGGTSGGRRWVVGLGAGYWRWAFWSDQGREVYDRLFSALAGWLVEERAASGPDAIGPAGRVWPRGSAIRWATGGLGPDSVRVRVQQADSVRIDSVFRTAGADTVISPALPPGHYRYEMAAWVDGQRVQGSGELTVESFSEEFTRPRVDAARLEGAPVALGDVTSARTPLRATVWPWAVLILMLSAEWILRRRWGLR